MKPDHLNPGDQSNEFIVAILAGTILFLLFACFITAYILIYRNKRTKHFKEMNKMKKIFEEELLKSRLEIQEHTFNHISQEIHDNVGQILSLAKIQLNILDEKDELDRSLLEDAQENISKAMNDLRDIAKGLSSERIQILNLEETVAYELQRVNKTGLLQVTVEVQGAEQKIDDQKKLIIFRIIQECFQNIFKHAFASSVKVEFDYGQDSLVVVVIDNGKGFVVPSSGGREKGLGLQNIVHRATLIGGTITIESTPDQGTKISLRIPYD
jgi:two-component system, NarL family, sensor kinase